MSGWNQATLLAILRAAHCRSTHHYFAIDALPLVRTEAGSRLVSQLLLHHDRYLTGAKDPDTRFRDFQNHVVHVDDGYWGGAPRVAHQWYDRLQRYLHQRQFSDAAHAAGVLSHYFTDPMQPLHTAQSPVEQVLHRPIEWSITQAYPSLIQGWRNDPTRTVFNLSDQPGWLGEAILHAARLAHRHYETVLTHYNLADGRRDPASGLDADLRNTLADLIGLAVTGWARVIERAAHDAQTRRGPIPRASMVATTVLAGLRVPTRMWLKRIESREERQAVLELIAEFERDGKLTEHLPNEQRVIAAVRGIRVREQAWRRQRVAAISSASESHEPKESAHESTSADPRVEVVAFPGPVDEAIRLHVSDPLVDAPSIGEKTAARFAAIGVHTVGDFLQTDVETLHRRLATKWITIETLQIWQCQSILMCQLPAMLARDVQLLVGAGYATADAIAKTSAAKLHHDIRRYADTYAGRRHLRGAEPMGLPRLETIIGDAALALVKQKRTLAREAAQEPIVVVPAAKPSRRAA